MTFESTFESALIVFVLSLFLAPIVFVFVFFFPAKIKIKRIAQIIATVMLVIASIGISILWVFQFYFFGFEQLPDIKTGLANSDHRLIVYYSPLYVMGLWIVNLFIFLRDMFSRKNADVLS